MSLINYTVVFIRPLTQIKDFIVFSRKYLLLMMTEENANLIRNQEKAVALMPLRESTNFIRSVKNVSIDALINAKENSLKFSTNKAKTIRPK